MLHKGCHAFFLLATITAFSAVLSSGCGRGNNRQSLEGVVTMDGKPLAEATISFQPAPGNTGGSSGAATDGEGRFSIPHDKGLVPGKYIVTIQKWVGTGRTFMDPHTNKPTEITAPIAFKEAGNLKADIADGCSNQLEFHLTSKK